MREPGGQAVIGTDRQAADKAAGESGRVGEYVLGDVLGHGATGLIYSAVNGETEERVAIKLPRRANDGREGREAAEELRREAEVLGRLDHPGIVHLRQVIDHDGAPCLVLDRLDGMSLESFLRRAADPPEEGVLRAILAPLVAAVEHIHAAGFLHRDLKPGNILLRRNGQPVLIDLGAASPRQPSEHAVAQWSALTAGYGAPEQYLEDGNEGPRTDVYGLGAVAYRAITGFPPTPAPARQRGVAMSPAAEAGRGRYSRAFLEAVDRALALEPADRPGSPGAWLDALRASAPSAAGSREPVPAVVLPEIFDDYPPTVRVERTGREVKPPAFTPVAEDSAKPGGRLRPWAWFALVACLTGLAAAGWIARPLYHRYVENEWVVDAAGGGDTVTIADALSRAWDGATIIIRPGTYAESLVMDRPAHLKAAEGAGEAALIAPEDGPCLVSKTATGSVVGLRFKGAAGGDAGVTGRPCIDIAGGGIEVEKNQITNPAGPGIRAREGAEPLIRRNAITETGGPGIVLTAGARGRIVDNWIDRAGRSGLVLRGGSAAHVVRNVVENSGQAGVLFAEGATGTFEQNTISVSRASGIEVRAGADPRVSGNRIESAGEAGIFVYDLGRGRFEANEVTESGLSGVVIGSGGAPRFTGNTVRESAEHGILVVERGGGLLDGNIVVDNGGHGIALTAEAVAEIGTNTLRGNKDPQLLNPSAPGS